MKIKNKPVTIVQAPSITGYFKLIEICLDSPPQGGFSPSEMVKRFKISEKLKGEIAEFDSGEIEKIKEVVKATGWAFRSKEIVEFSDYIEKL